MIAMIMIIMTAIGLIMFWCPSFEPTEDDRRRSGIDDYIRNSKYQEALDLIISSTYCLRRYDVKKWLNLVTNQRKDAGKLEKLLSGLELKD